MSVCKNATGPRLNVFPTKRDDALGMIFDVVKDNRLEVSGRQDLEQALAAQVQREAHFVSLDLIAHAQADIGNVLRMGDWFIVDGANLDAFMRSAAPSIRALGIKQIRLLGCDTALAEGKRTLVALKKGLPVEAAFGTNYDLDHTHYGPDGLGGQAEQAYLRCQLD